MNLFRIPGRPLGTVAALGGLVLLAACGGGSSGSTPSATATPCSVPNTTFTLVSPAPGSTGVSANTTSISVQASQPIPAMVEFFLIDKAGASQQAGQTTGSNPYSATVTLVAGDTYNVYFSTTAQPGCTAQPIGGATFST